MESEKTKRILVIDDEDVILFSYRKIYQGQHLTVDVCKTPEDAIELIRTNYYDAIISDVRFSDSESAEGLDILRYVNEHCPSIPVILMTGYGSAEIRDRAVELGVAYYFDKPVAISMIDYTLKSLGIIQDNN